MRQRAFHHALRGRPAVFGQDILLHRAGVHANAHRNVMGLHTVGENTHVLLSADVAGVNAQFVNAVFHRLDGELVIKMNVGDQRNGAPVHQRAHRFGACLVVNGYANDIRARHRQRADLGERRLHVRRVRIGHRLYADRRAPADEDVSGLDLPCLCAHVFLPQPFTKNRIISLYVSSTISPISSAKPAR